MTNPKREEQIKLIAGNLMRTPMATPADAVRLRGNPLAIMRHTVERAVAAGLSYRDGSDAQVAFDIEAGTRLVNRYMLAAGSDEVDPADTVEMAQDYHELYELCREMSVFIEELCVEAERAAQAAGIEVG